jgi:Uma2 family endonuclease
MRRPPPRAAGPAEVATTCGVHYDPPEYDRNPLPVAGRLRLPEGAGGDVFTEPPRLCAELLSPDARMSRLTTLANEFLALGVPAVWFLDPIEKNAFVVDPKNGFHEEKETVSAFDGSVSLTLEEIFALI